MSMCYAAFNHIASPNLTMICSWYQLKKPIPLNLEQTDTWFLVPRPGYSGRSRLTMMTSSNGNIFRATGPLCGEFTGHRWIPRTKASDAELWCFLRSAHWINGWANTREAGDLRRHRAHYDVTVILLLANFSEGTQTYINILYHCSTLT